MIFSVHQHERGGGFGGVKKTGGKSNLFVKHNGKIVFYFILFYCTSRLLNNFGISLALSLQHNPSYVFFNPKASRCKENTNLDFTILYSYFIKRLCQKKSHCHLEDGFQVAVKILREYVYFLSYCSFCFLSSRSHSHGAKKESYWFAAFLAPRVMVSFPFQKLTNY